jgi:hypothetical protein
MRVQQTLCLMYVESSLLVRCLCLCWTSRLAGAVHDQNQLFKLDQTSQMWVAGRPYVSRATAGPGADALLPSPFHMQPRPDSSVAQPAGVSPVFPARVADVSMGSRGWSRPYSPMPPFLARSAFESRPPSAAFQQASDQVC